MKATAIANSNIAIIKYWGKKDGVLNLPSNSSLSFTMDDQLSTVTTVEFDEGIRKDDLVLDGKHANENEFSRVTTFLDLIRARAKIKSRAKVVSFNSFPKGAGLASSASGFAALAAAAVKAAGTSAFPKEISMLARQGSGSASRSVYGGCVEWLEGNKKNGEDSYAQQVLSKEKCSDFRNVIAIAETREKKISSRAGMKETVLTSSLYQQRMKDVGKRFSDARNALKKNDFSALAKIIMQDSNSMHATMLDTYPPIIYLNESSKMIIEKIHELNHSYGHNVAAYTFDAGPNGNVYTTAKHAPEVKRMLSQVAGVETVLECKIGDGVRYIEKHLF